MKPGNVAMIRAKSYMMQELIHKMLVETNLPANEVKLNNIRELYDKLSDDLEVIRKAISAEIQDILLRD